LRCGGIIRHDRNFPVDQFSHHDCYVLFAHVVAEHREQCHVVVCWHAMRVGRRNCSSTSRKTSSMIDQYPE